ncbi:hypothetical protein [Paucihalobacter sp.]|uniref:hypothetical protein n=1 Tax=Paucihalobacter sp. TaxID=2850405 RepID=UPI002FDF1895
MKTIGYFSKLITFFALVFFVSCQDEVTEITQPTEQETLVPDSPLARNIFNMSTLSSNASSIVTSTSCLAIDLPFTIIVNGNEIIIETEEDYDIVATIFDEFDDDDDELQIVYPITLILFDYSEVVVNNNDELEFYIEECLNSYNVDDDIECINFEYPITLSLFNTAFQFLETVVVNNDQELFNFLDDDFDDDDVIAAINYPINVILFDGTVISVNNNSELNNIIEANSDDCDDDSNTNLSIDELEALLLECFWKVDDLEIDDQELDDLYEDFLIDFREGGMVVVTGPQSIVYNGTWSLTETTTSIKLNLQIDGLPDLNNAGWVFRKFEDDDDDDEIEVKFRNIEDELELEQVCISTNNEEVQNLRNIITDGSWFVSLYFDDEDDTLDFQNLTFVFNSNGSVDVSNQQSNVVTGSWSSFSNSQNQLKLLLIFPEDSNPLDDLDDDWDVLTITENRIELTDDDDRLTFDKI